MRKVQSREICERVYTDVVGPVQEASFEESVYFVTLIDDFSEYSMTRILNANSEVAEVVQEIITEWEVIHVSRKRTWTSATRFTLNEYGPMAEKSTPATPSRSYCGRKAQRKKLPPHIFWKIMEKQKD